MILIGQYDSPFVRRVAIALRLYGLPFEHRPWSVFGDAEKIRIHNPLTRVPTLVLDNGEVLLESHAMLDYLDTLAPIGQRLFPAHGVERYRALRIAALACGAAEKAVALFYELRLHQQVSQIWAERCRSQVEAALSLLENERSGKPGDFWFGRQIGHADIAVAVALRFIGEAHPGLFDPAGFPAMASHAARLEAMPVFGQTSQPFVPPA